MKKSELVASGMTLPQIGQAIVHAVWNNDGGDNDAKIVIHDNVLCDEIAKLIMRRHIVTVDRTVPPTYPSWLISVEHPELENTGPKDLDIGRLRHFSLFRGEGRGKTFYSATFKHLEDYGMLSKCFNLRDLEEIQKKGVWSFREHFPKGRVVIGWQSVVRGTIMEKDYELYYPCLREVCDEVHLCWIPEGNFGDKDFSVLYIENK